jgi:amino acid transporter
MANPAEPVASPLPRVIGPGRFALIVVGITIGTAIFRVPSLIAANAGSPSMTAAVWLLGAVFAVAGGLCASELASRLPGAGGEYALGKAVYGDRFGFIFGLSWLLLVSPASIAAVARTFADYAAVFTPLSEGARRALTAVVIISHTLLSVASTKVATRFIGAATLAKLLAMVAVVVAAMILSAPGAAAQPLPANAGSAGAVIAAIVAVIWAYDGSSQVMLAGDVADPVRNIPRGLMLGTGIVVVIYLSLNVAYGKTLGFAGLAGSTAVAADTMQALVGRVGALLLAGLVLLSSFSCGMAQLVGHPRVTFGLANDGLFFARFAQLTKGAQTPAAAILLHGALAIVLSLLGGYEFLIRLVVFAFYPVVGAIYFGAILLRRRQGLPPGFRMPFYPLPIVFYLVMFAVVMVVSLQADPTALLYAVAVMAVAVVGSRFVPPRRAGRPSRGVPGSPPS